MQRHPSASAARQAHYRLMRRIYALCASGEWRVRYARIDGNRRLAKKHGISTTTVGFVDGEPQIIWIDYRRDLLSTFVHECLHVIVGDRFASGKREERHVLSLEKRTMRMLSPCQARRLHMHLTNMLAADHAAE